MSDQHIAVYLNDHLAGSVVALELLEHLEKAHAGTDLERFLAGLRADITADRQELEALMGRLHVTTSSPRKAMAWLAEKFTELKLRLDDAAGGTLRLFESLEAVALGIDGKRALWRALAAAETPGLGVADYERLERRAEEQRSRIETARLDAARAALKAAP
jgi:hypothetical protein